MIPCQLLQIHDIFHQCRAMHLVGMKTLAVDVFPDTLYTWLASPEAWLASPEAWAIAIGVSGCR